MPSHRRQQSKNSPIPTWLVVAVILVAAISGAYALLSNTSKQLKGEEFDFDARFGRYQRESVDDPIGARSILLAISKEPLTAQQRLLVDAELNKEDENLDEIDEALRNDRATKWMNIRLIGYSESNWNPKGDRAHARLFMKRAKWFVAEYPTHPDLDRVRRLMDRIGPVAEPGSPMSLEDLKVDVWGSTSAEPKDFGEAFDAIEKFASSADGPDKTGAEQLRQETLNAEREFYDEKLADAAVVYDKAKYPTKYDPSVAIEDMVRIVIGCRTESLRADGAARLLGISEFSKEMLEAYRRSQPTRFEKLMSEPSLRAFAEDLGVQ